MYFHGHFSRPNQPLEAIALSPAASCLPKIEAPVRGKSQVQARGADGAPERRANANDSELAPGRYAAQVGAFRIETSAYSVRDQVSSQLATVGTFVANEGVTRVVRRGSLFHVLVGETDSAKAATALAARVREALKQDVIVYRP